MDFESKKRLILKEGFPPPLVFSLYFYQTLYYYRKEGIGERRVTGEEKRKKKEKLMNHKNHFPLSLAFPPPSTHVLFSLFLFL